MGDALPGLSPAIFYNFHLHCLDAWTNFGFSGVPTIPIEPLVASNRGPQAIWFGFSLVQERC